MMDKKIKDLLDKYKDGTLSKDEKTLLDSWYINWNTDQKIDLSEEEINQDLKLIRAAIPHLQSPSNTRYIWYRAAAAILIISFSLGLYYFNKQKSQKQYYVKNDVLPGSNKAILHLANGNKIDLSDVSPGELDKNANHSIKKTADGNVIYSAAQNNQELSYDTLTIPRAGTYRLTLSDGSKVWLNAATAIRYPENFSGNDRKVELLYGEAYFEVVHNSKKPFIVVSSNQTVEDIGTHFNINAYSDERSVKTTLLEGSVRVSNKNERKLLIPGQQSQITLGNANINVVSKSNTEEIVAWKNGYFRFNDEKIESIMKKLARWYDVEVDYQGKAPSEGFYGKISRFNNISEVLNMLEETKGVKFKIEGRRIIVKQ